VLLVALGALSVVHFREMSSTAPTTSFQVFPPDKATVVDYPTISPDGRRLAFVATVEGQTRLWVRPFDSLAAQLPRKGTPREDRRRSDEAQGALARSSPRL